MTILRSYLKSARLRRRLSFAEDFFVLDRSEIREGAKRRQFPTPVSIIYTAFAQILEFSSAGSVASRESQESEKQDKDETAVVHFLNDYLQWILDEVGFVRTLDDRLVTLQNRTPPFSKGLRLHAVEVVCKTDGSVVVALDSGAKSKATPTHFPIFKECKRLLHRKPEDSIVGQVAAELLSIVQFGQEQKHHDNPEAFGILLHHRHAQIVSACFSEGYLDKLETAHPTIDFGQGDFFAIKTTRTYDLAIVSDRREFTIAVMSLFKYVVSGRARIGRLDELKTENAINM
ncbi:uncharacterized protein EV422DRAFT_209637 [Fimicolochytrium jonesii]|uniref:uncharacterized protein n=1 Tax=Fimicolochytrium jonesii TaxID=1396493 RepID=UPI0022FF42CA|nr:uncharacterized protein EV422DRAFT_209637 [Fimicolochytrium jonesii]KAI8817882.1 hypothetical protein EV422DRAFT_209637 [Fimicolochytrium jonesii]